MPWAPGCPTGEKVARWWIATGFMYPDAICGSMSSTRVALILAGGKGSRMGYDKGMLRLAGRPLVEHVMDALAPLVESVYLSVGWNEGSYLGYSGRVHLLRDPVPDRGPLAGFAALSTRLRERKDLELLVLVSSVDTPFILPGFYTMLTEACRGYDAAIPYNLSGYLDPMHAVYTLRALHHMGAVFKGGDTRPLVAIRGVRANHIPASDVRRVDPDMVSLFDLNTKGDLDRAEREMRYRVPTDGRV